MIKSLAALAVFGLLGTAVILLPEVAPPAQARESVALPKGDRLDVRPVARNCSQQIWPRFDAACLRKGDTGATVREARLIASR
jgi:hypothetical protein